jgi:hypothetical protein
MPSNPCIDGREEIPALPASRACVQSYATDQVRARSPLIVQIITKQRHALAVASVCPQMLSDEAPLEWAQVRPAMVPVLDVHRTMPALSLLDYSGAASTVRVAALSGWFPNRRNVPSILSIARSRGRLSKMPWRRRRCSRAFPIRCALAGFACRSHDARRSTRLCVDCSGARLL